MTGVSFAGFVADSLMPWAAGFRHPGQQVTQAEHALRCAHIAAVRGADDELVAVAFVHDLAKPLSEVRHGEVLAAATVDRFAQHHVDLLQTHGAYVAQLNHGEPQHPIGDDDEAAELGMRFARWDHQALVPGRMADLDDMLRLVERIVG